MTSYPITPLRDSQPRKQHAVYWMFFASGASALIYQIIWSRWLGLIFGNTSTSVAIVLGSFMLGLALGSWAAGRILPRIANPMRAYALLELFIGLFALVFPFLSLAAESVFTLLVDTTSAPEYSMGVKTLLAFMLLVFPTTCMGATLPLMTEFFRRSPLHSCNWKVGLLYAANTAGAAVGIFAAAFLLIELLGVRATTLLAALLNFAVALAGFHYAGPRQLSIQETIYPVARLNRAGKIAVAVLTVSGGVALASEVLWTRTLETLVGGSTYAFASIVLVYLLGIALGSWVFALFVKRLQRLPCWLGGILLGMAVWNVVAIQVFIQLHQFLTQYSSMELSPWYFLGFYLLAALVLLPLAFLSGALFPVATRVIDYTDEDIAGQLLAIAYSGNTLGALAGSLLGGFLIAPFLGFFDALYALAILYSMAAFITLFLFYQTRIFHSVTTVVLGVAALAMIGWPLWQMGGPGYFVRSVEQQQRPQVVVYHQPGLQGVTSVVKLPGIPRGDRLLVNGRGMTAKVNDTKMMAHLPMALHPHPENTLIICFGMGTTYRSAISYGEQVTVVELVAEVFEAFDYFYPDAAQVRAYPHGRMVINDGRNFLKLTAEKFDVITIDPPPPIDGAGVNHLYSKEFIELAKSRLKEGGIMAHWLPFPKTGNGVESSEAFNMLIHAFIEVFPEAIMTTSVNNIGMHLFGKVGGEWEPDLAMHIERYLAHPGVRQDLAEWEDIPTYHFMRFAPWHKGQFTLVKEGQELSVDTSKAPFARLLSDDRPYLEFYLLNSFASEQHKVLHPVF